MCYSGHLTLPESVKKRFVGIFWGLGPFFSYIDSTIGIYNCEQVRMKVVSGKRLPSSPWLGLLGYCLSELGNLNQLSQQKEHITNFWLSIMFSKINIPRLEELDDSTDVMTNHGRFGI